MEALAIIAILLMLLAYLYDLHYERPKPPQQREAPARFSLIVDH
jgi:hypothetical protein